ncbi:MAG: hypothetical protein QOJ94_2641 [Sphingomonadales bacterium]|jgi:hypothetical protein|nr:hypothetical protein [Sphingomonadales bacterium]
MAELAGLQAWLQDAILAGGAADGEADRQVVSRGALDAAGRVGVYAGGYRARLVECLRDEYPALRRFAGETAFDLFARSYVAARQSRSRTLWDYGEGFAAYLESNAPAAAREPGSPLAVPAQLARLERARAEVQRARGIEREDRPAVTADALLVPGARLAVPDSVRLLALDFDLAPLVRASDRGDSLTAPEARPSWIAIARTRYRIQVHELDVGQHAFLAALADGAAADSAAARAADSLDRSRGAVIAELALWLPVAAQQGLVVAATAS